MPISLKQMEREIIISSTTPSPSVSANFYYNPTTLGLYEKVGSTWFPVGHGAQPFASRILRSYTDFCGALTGQDFTSNTGNGGSLNQNNNANEPLHPGIAVLGTGSASASGRSRISGVNNQGVFGTGATWIYTASMRSVTALSDATDSYYLYGGFSNEHYPTNNCLVAMYTHSNNSNTGTWRLVARNNNAESIAESDTPLALNTWYRVTVVVYGSSSAELYIDGTFKTSLNTNIPNGTNRNTTYYTGIAKYLGTAARNIELDYMECIAIFSSPR